MNELICTKCRSDLFASENTIGIPLTNNFCEGCWSSMKAIERKEWIKKGAVPITRNDPRAEWWVTFCAKYGMQP